MVNVNIDDELYEGIKEVVKKNKYNYPSIKFFVQKAVHSEFLKFTGSSETIKQNKDKAVRRLIL